MLAWLVARGRDTMRGGAPTCAPCSRPRCNESIEIAETLSRSRRAARDMGVSEVLTTTELRTTVGNRAEPNNVVSLAAFHHK